MISVAIVADGCGKVLLFVKSHRVDAFLVFLDLVGRDAIGLHIFWVRMTAAARFGDVPGESRRLGEIGCLDAVNTVAIGADRNFRVAFLEKLAVLACPIEVELVNPQVGVEAPHESGVRMAGPAGLGNLESSRRSLETLVFGQLDILLVGVAAMTVGATQSELFVDISRKRFNRDTQFAFKLSVAVETRIFLSKNGQREDENKNKDSRPFEHDPEASVPKGEPDSTLKDLRKKTWSWDHLTFPGMKKVKAVIATK